MIANGVTLEVLIDGRPATEYPHLGHSWIHGVEGPYELLFTNGTLGRVLVVPSVDGLSVMDGLDAKENGIGYLIERGKRLVVPGWRRNGNEVAHFGFGGTQEAYAYLMRRPENIGVIAAAVFAEFVPPLSSLLYESSYSNVKGGSATMSRGVGTVFGDRTEHHVVATTFVRGSRLGVLQIRYATAEELAARGIIVGDPILAANPFPGDKQPDLGCTPPAGWNG